MSATTNRPMSIDPHQRCAKILNSVTPKNHMGFVVAPFDALSNCITPEG